MFTRSKQNANEAQLQFMPENPITLCGRIAHTAWAVIVRVKNTSENSYLLTFPSLVYIENK
jgi:hypothetical protein